MTWQFPFWARDGAEVPRGDAHRCLDAQFPAAAAAFTAAERRKRPQCPQINETHVHGME